MMPRRQPLPIAQAAPLLVAPELARHRQLAREVESLRADIARYKPNAHRRLVLEDRVKQKICEMLALEATLYGRRS
jgi:hypothetical protein